jgi:heme exporter protein CcmD
MSALLNMGGYAAWPAYGVTVLGLGIAIAMTLRAYARAKLACRIGKTLKR